MKTYTVQSGQTLIDLALELYGAAEAVVELAALNDLNIDEALSAGQTVVYDPADVVDRKVVSFFAQRGIIVNSGLVIEDVVTILADADGVLLQDYDNALIEANR